MNHEVCKTSSQYTKTQIIHRIFYSSITPVLVQYNAYTYQLHHASMATKESNYQFYVDLEYSYHETVTVTPRNKRFVFRHVEDVLHHPAMIGMAYVVDDDPLYYEATNESGLSIAGLNFPGNAQYNKPVEGKDNIASFELIPWILSTCKSVADAREKLARINITDDSYSDAIMNNTYELNIPSFQKYENINIIKIK